MPVFSSGQWGGAARHATRRVGCTDLIFACGGGIIAPSGRHRRRRGERARGLGGRGGRRPLDGLRARPSGAARGDREFGAVRGDDAWQPARPLLAFYGDDFTGSTDVAGGARLRRAAHACCSSTPPTRRTLRALPRLRAIGVAGDSRGHDARRDGRAPAAAAAGAGGAGAPVAALQGLLDLRFRAGGRQHRARDRSGAPSGGRRAPFPSSPAPRRWGATRVRQPVRRRTTARSTGSTGTRP